MTGLTAAPGRRPHAASPRRRAATLAAGAVAGAGLLGAVDPNVPGRYPVCPTSALLGLDCPACGTLRGVHALLHLDIATALDHNLLLLVAAPLALVALLGALAPLVGRPSRRLPMPRWAGVAALSLAVAFTVLRNLPIAALDHLGSGA